MRHAHVARLPIYFIRTCHRWVDISRCDGYSKGRCEDCGLIALQDRGSLDYFVSEGYSGYASLSCIDIQVKKILE